MASELIAENDEAEIQVRGTKRGTNEKKRGRKNALKKEGKKAAEPSRRTEKNG